MKYEKYEGKSMPLLSNQQRQVLLLEEYGLVAWDLAFLLKLALEILCDWSVPSKAKLKIIVTPLQVWQICRSSSPLEEKWSAQSPICLFIKDTGLIFLNNSQECESLKLTFFLCSQTLSFSPGLGSKLLLWDHMTFKGGLEPFLCSCSAIQMNLKALAARQRRGL